jgi:hypothetical protein
MIVKRGEGSSIKFNSSSGLKVVQTNACLIACSICEDLHLS